LCHKLFPTTIHAKDELLTYSKVVKDVR